MLRTAGNCAGLLRGGGLALLNDCLITEELSSLASRRWASKKQGGSTKNKKDSQPKHLGVKINEGQLIYPGQIILRQRGTKFFPGGNVAMGKDHTLHAKAVGFVKFSEVPFERLNVFRRRRYVHVVPRNQHWELDVDADQNEMVATKAAAKQLLSRFYRQTSIRTAQ